MDETWSVRVGFAVDPYNDTLEPFAEVEELRVDGIDLPPLLLEWTER